MKKFLLKVFLFFTFVVVMDFAFGFIFSWLRSHAKGGSTANCEYIANIATDDIIILGSSRATHHYVPQIIEDLTGKSCYNCGEEGNGIVLAYGRLKMLTNRYKPKLVLYEITPNYDYEAEEPNNKYLGYLRPYYNKDGIEEIFCDFDDELSWLKMKSKMYQNTGRLLPVLVDNVIFRDNSKGYEPLSGVMTLTKKQSSKQKYNENAIPIDSVKLSYVEKMIVLCHNNGIPLVFMISPWYNYGHDMSRYEPALQMCEKYGVEVYNNISNPCFTSCDTLFQDANHLNNRGASLYTQYLIPMITEMVR